MSSQDKALPSAARVPNRLFVFSASPAPSQPASEASDHDTPDISTASSPAAQDAPPTAATSSARGARARPSTRRPTRTEQRRKKPPPRQVDVDYVAADVKSSKPASQLGMHQTFEVDLLGRSQRVDRTYFDAVKPAQRRKLNNAGSFAPGVFREEPAIGIDTSEPVHSVGQDGWLDFDKGPEAADPDGSWDDLGGEEVEVEGSQGTQRKFYASSVSTHFPQSMQ
ncbi:hypothetical protein CYLTODRAFT_484069 [Cylindrobasidium torrendii FP15055 ss-10]|uniref:Uncharacterized protein n=1 Tax=Cylindrobasidium torrendii FP15055 ss-10 TaxID=1314674 RepID=A0A0D7AQR2_9AGAR|nr:hypothetical protein CYLTODRAFT_484069 [Cylindrobasidium torrendii FP15055 ss-10]